MEADIKGIRIGPMLQTISPQYSVLPTTMLTGALIFRHLIGIAKRRVFYFAIPFVLVVMIGFGIVAIQRPIYRAEGKILVMSPEIPADLVRPTITEVANQRVQIIQQRIMARDSLMAVVNKFDLFPRERQWMSGYRIARSGSVADGNQAGGAGPANVGPSNPTIAFTLSFDYEVPVLP